MFQPLQAPNSRVLEAVIGWILDLSGGMSVMGLGLAFLHVAFIMAIGQVAFRLLPPRDLAGDRSLTQGS